MKTHNFVGYTHNDSSEAVNTAGPDKPVRPVEEPGSTTGTEEIREDSEWKHKAFTDEEEEEEVEDKNDEGDYEEEEIEEEEE